jgi:hypothetical protein
MGHTRLGKIPTTRRWRDVVAIFAASGAGIGNPDSSDEVPRLAASTMDAAANALKAGLKDGGISRAFFSGLMSRMLGFYLSKFVLPGEGQRLIGGANDLTRFNAELRAHTYQRAAIIHEFAEKWFSKTEFEKGIDPTNARRFVSYACKKIEIQFLRGMDGK